MEDKSGSIFPRKDHLVTGVKAKRRKSWKIMKTNKTETGFHMGTSCVGEFRYAIKGSLKEFGGCKLPHNQIADCARVKPVLKERDFRLKNVL